MTNAEYLYARLREAGCTPQGAVAVLANVQAESAFIVNNLEDRFNRSLGISDEEFVRRVDAGDTNLWMTQDLGFGIYQITYWSRKQKFLNYVKSKGASIGSLEAQVDFMIKEFKEDFPGIWNMLCTSTDLVACTDKLLVQWENPAVKDYNNRRSNAQNWYAKVNQLEANVGKGTSSTQTSTANGGGVKKMTKNEAVKKVLDIARAEIGYHETGDNVTKYAAEMDRTNWYNGPKNGFAWCDVFYDWLFYKAFGDSLGKQMICQPSGSAGAGCLYSANYYKQAGRWTNVPEDGAQIFFTYSPGEYSHTGIVESVNGNTVTTIEGNTSDQVARRQYAVGSSNIAGYGIPRWELATGSSSSEPVTPVTPSSGGSDSSSTPSVDNSIIRKGARGAKVKELQEKLISLGYSCGPDGADGDFGNNTRSAVIEFQKKAFPGDESEWDGEVGPKTRAALEEALKNKDSGGSATTVLNSAPAENNFKNGEIVWFKGGKFYVYCDRDKVRGESPAGNVKLTIIRLGAKHQYHVTRISGSEAKAFGWVDRDQIEVI